MLHARIALAALAAIVMTTGYANRADAHTKDWAPCKYEDSINCVWDAKHMGNGEGRSFKVSKAGNITYLTHRRAHHLLNH